MRADASAAIAKESQTSAPETFALSPNRLTVYRTVTSGDGSTHRTEFALSKPPRKRQPAQHDLAALADASFLRSTEWPSLVPNATAVRVADVFSGAGLMSLGIWEACRAAGRRMEPIVAADMNADALRVYQTNFPGVVGIGGNIEGRLDRAIGEELSPLERAFGEQIGHIDILIGGPPCQGHSDLNNYTRRVDPKNRLYQRMARFAEVVLPNHIIVENVSAVLHDRHDVVSTTKIRLIEIGYEVDDAVVEIGSLGLPQHRRRHVLVASRTRTPNIARSLAAYERPTRSLKWAISDLRRLSAPSEFDRASTAGRTNQKRIDYLFDHGKYDLPNSQRPDCHKNNPGHSYKSVYGRLHWDRPAQTITSGFTCMGQGRFVHPRERRTLTPHEAARLQFIPDFFHIGEGVKRTALAQLIGNAVPPKLTYTLALELLR